jgi:hypothetical protein
MLDVNLSTVNPSKSTVIPPLERGGFFIENDHFGGTILSCPYR